MDPIRNPYAPGAGSQPPELAGRDEILETVHIALERIKIGRHSKSVLMVGLRGVGKTVLLDKMRENAEIMGHHALRIEVPENRSLPAILIPQLRVSLIKLSKIQKAKSLAQRAMKALAGFANGMKVKYGDVEVGIDLEPEPGLADNGDLEVDLQELLEAVAIAAKSGDTSVAIFIDELQYVEEKELAALITALHRASQRQLPITLVGAGLPQLRGKMGRAKSYAERLFEFVEIGPLNKLDSLRAIEKPARDEGVEFQRDALEAIAKETQGYPYFLQEWGKNTWEVADESPVTGKDVEIATEQALADLDASFFLVRFDRLTPSEKKYLRAMAELGPGPHRSGDVARTLNREVSSLAPTRNQLISKGMVWSPNHGDTAFTVPLFDLFMKRVMPKDDWMNS